MKGGLFGNEEFEKALDEIRLDTDHPAAASLWSEMLVQGGRSRTRKIEGEASQKNQADETG